MKMQNHVTSINSAVFSALMTLFLSVGVAVQAGPVTIAALGDSLTQGYGLPVEQGFVPQLDRWLEAHETEVRLINAGVSGDTTAGGLARVDWTLSDDVDALIVALGGNDLLRGIDPKVSRANLSGILSAAQARGLPVLLIGQAAPGNFGEEFRTEFDAIFLDLAAEYGVILYPSFLASLDDGRDRAEVLRDLMQADAIHPNAKGVALIVSDVGPFVVQLAGQAK